MKRSSLYKALFAASTAVALVACSSDDIARSGSEEDATNAIVFTVSTGNRASRAFTTFDNYWTMDDKMAICEGTTVYGYKAVETSGTSGGRVLLTPSEATPTDGFPNGYAHTGNAFFWTAESKSRVFCGWYPYSAAKPTDVSVDINQSETGLNNAGYNNLDLLYAPNLSVSYKTTVDLTFYHQMCRILVTVNSTATKKSKPVTDIKLGKNNVAIGGTLALGNEDYGSWTLGGKNYTVTMRLQSADSDAHLYTFECIVPPQALADTETLFQITTTAPDNSTKTTEYVPKSMYTDAPNFQAGHQYNYSVTLSASGMVNISTVQVYDWTTETLPSQEATVPDASY